MIYPERQAELRRTVFKLIQLYIDDDLERYGGIARECCSHCEGEDEQAEREFVKLQIRDAIRRLESP